MNRREASSALVSRRVACDLTGIDPARLDDLIRRGSVRVERIRKLEYVNLEDAERHAAEGGGTS